MHLEHLSKGLLAIVCLSPSSVTGYGYYDQPGDSDGYYNLPSGRDSYSVPTAQQGTYRETRVDEVQQTIVEYSIYSSGYSSFDTIFSHDGGITVDTTNAPTLSETFAISSQTPAGTMPPASSSLQTPAGTIAPASSSLPDQTTTPTSEPSSAATVSSMDTPFLLFMSGLGNNELSRRQTTINGYLQSYGTTADACQQGSLYSLQNGQLSNNNRYYSTSENVFNEPFTPSSTVNDISTTFALSGGVLSWTNNNFNNGAARFCNYANRMTEVVFLGDLPAGCTMVMLRLTGGKPLP
ncbi:MAG: hypothetical protein M1827_004761 [Pycnora praestabilis]|nr:MAG: hypothetical protein M1827_004761 [Pycnora praestabilis]